MSTNGAYAGLRMAARAAAPDPELDPTKNEPDEDEDEASAKDGKKKEPNHMTTETTDTALAEAKAAGFAEANARCNAVLASDHYAGRETLAQAMLGNDKLSAEDITALLATAPKAEAAPKGAAADDDDAAARVTMAGAIAANKNSAVDVSGADAPLDDAKVAAAGFAKAAAFANQINGH